MSIYIHMGLHKTATKYYQYFVFPFLSSKFLYNPEKLLQLLTDCIKADKTDRKSVLKILHAEVDDLLKNNPGKKIVISREAMSGSLFTAYEDWDEITGLLKDMFPDAHLILTLRFQPNWLISCYRESLHEHHYQNVSDFLCYDKKFTRPKSDMNKNGYANLYALNLDYSRMITRLKSLFDKVDIYFFEEFVKDRKAFTAEMLKSINSPQVKAKKLDHIPNRGYSALA